MDLLAGDIDESLAIQLVDHNQIVDSAYRVANKGLTLSLSLEMEHLVGGIYQAHVRKDMNLGLENILKAAWDMIVRFFTKIKETFTKFIGWFKSGSKTDSDSTASTSVPTVEAVEETKAIVGDPEVKRSVDTILAEAAKLRNTNVGTEDYFPYQNSTTTDHFENFRKSLSSDEVDFLTSGHRYTKLRDTVRDFVDAKFPVFLEHFDKELLHWGDSALDQAKHIGKDPDVVADFIKEQTKHHASIMSGYRKQIDTAAAMTHADDSVHSKTNYEHLYLFHRRPSELYPHIERLWNEIHFERIGEQDKHLLSALEGIVSRYDKLIQKYRGYANEVNRDWPAEQEMLKLIAAAHREGAQVMSNIMRVTSYLRRSVTTAFQVTMKSFSYLVRIFHIVGNMRGVDNDKVKKSLEVIQDRRKKLIAVLAAIS